MFMGIHGYSMSIRKKFVGIRRILLENLEGIIRVLGKVLVYFRFSKIFSNVQILFRILSNTLGYFGVLWNTYLKKSIPKKL